MGRLFYSIPDIGHVCSLNGRCGQIGSNCQCISGAHHRTLYRWLIYIYIAALAALEKSGLVRCWYWASGVLLLTALVVQAGRLSHSPFKHLTTAEITDRNELVRILGLSR